MSISSAKMPSYIDDDLISLTDSIDESSVVVSPISPTSTGPMNNDMAVNCRKSAQRDSFSDLAGLMKAKKPYVPIIPPSSRPRLLPATNGMQFANRVDGGNAMLSPLARPYHTDGSVAVHLQRQARSPTRLTSAALEYRQPDMQHLESIPQELEDSPTNHSDKATVKQHARYESTTNVEPLLSGFELTPALPIRTGAITPPTPAASIKPFIPEEPVVIRATHVCDDMGSDLEALKNEKRGLEVKIAALEKATHMASYQDGDYNTELQTQIGKLQYQNELNKTQKATMARTLSDKDVEIKQLQLEVDNLKQSMGTTASAGKHYADVIAERDHLQSTLENDKATYSLRLAELTKIKDHEVEILSNKVDDLEEALRQSKIHRDATAKAESDADDHKARAQNLLDQLAHREKLLRSTQEKYASEHARVGELEYHLDDLERKLSQTDDLQGMLREKSSECDWFRNKLKNQERIVEDYKQRILRASDDGAALRGAAHLVKPNANTTFSILALGCSECYAKNISCDNKARCRHCTENNEHCARWRCSLKHILGFCPDTMCRFPHDDQGWLGYNKPRPEW